MPDNVRAKDGATLAHGKKPPACLSNCPSLSKAARPAQSQNTYGLLDQVLKASPYLKQTDSMILGCGRAAQSRVLQAPNGSLLPLEREGQPWPSQGKPFPRLSREVR